MKNFTNLSPRAFFLSRATHSSLASLRRFSRHGSMAALIFLLHFFVFSGSAYSQSESNNPITYDTTITETANGEGPFTWQVRVTRQLNDTAHRPAIFSIPGAGETGTDTNNLVKWGPHYWLRNGWNGGVLLGNGKHYPILITLEQPAQNMRPWHTKALLEKILNIFPIKRNSVHVAGLSQGSYEWGELIGFSAFAGDESAMSEVKSWVDLEGVGPGDNFLGFDKPYPYVYGTWARKYGGRFFGLEGTQDSRNIWQITQAMNDTVPNTGYFSYESFGGGGHCCWDSMYDPSVTNWQCVAPVTNPKLAPSTNPASSMGDYHVDPTTGTNIFQWMLRQGDTSLAGTVVNQRPTVNGGGNRSVTLPADSVTLTGTASGNGGATITSSTWARTSGPNMPAIVASNGGLTAKINGLVQGTYVFTLTSTDSHGLSASSPDTVTVLAAGIPPTVSGGGNKSVTLPVDTVVLNGSASGNGGATIHAIVWTTTSGPNSPTIVTSNSAQTATIRGLIQGIYIFTVTVTDSHGLTNSATDTVTVFGQPPTVSAGGNKTVTLPVDTVVLNGSATGHGGATIHLLVWTTTSGPNSPTIVTSNSAQTATIHGLIQGTYVFTITATDSHGLTNSSSVTVTVNPAAGGTVSAVPKTFVATGEYQVFFIDSSKHLYGVGTNLGTLGVGGAGTPGTTLPVALPSNLTVKAAAGGLHGGAAIDMNGNLWSWGENSQGQVGNGTASSTQVLTPVEITTDSAGNTFTGITALCAYFSGNVSEGWYAIKSDSTLWVWGQTLGGMRGNGTAGSTSSARPVQVPVPGNRKVVQVVAGDILIVRCSDSTVWTGGGAGGNAQNLGYAVSGNSYLSLQQLTTLSGITQIAGGASFNYALKSNGKLYGWGYYGYYLGGTGGTNTPLATPTDLTTRLNLPHPVKSIVVNMVCTHAILSDSTLWGWGDNAEGGIGNGHELNFATTTMPYAWDYYPAELLQQSPVQITTRKDFVAVFATQPFVMYTYAETAAGQLYSWGRNKGGVLGNGIVGCSSDVVATYPNSWDVTTATTVNPLSVTTTTVGPCPYCVANPDSTPCNECSAGGAARKATVKTNAGAALQTDGAGHILGQFIIYPSVAQDNEALHMAVATASYGPVKIRICDMNGKLLRSLQLNKSETYFNQSVQVGHLPSGMYIVQALIGNKDQFTAKFIRL